MKLHLAFSSCPNDTFIFHALVNGCIDTRGIEFEVTLADVETLNREAAKGKHDVTKLSFAAFAHLRDRYRILRTGAALGRGCGPLVVGLPGSRLQAVQNPRIAVPGMKTTAVFLFRLFLKDLDGTVEPELVPMPFDQIMPAVLDRKVDFGVVIHEGRFVYQDLGLSLVRDLGNWWEEYSSLPVPLGCIAAKKDLDPKLGRTVETLIGESIRYARNNPGAGDSYIRRHARELSREVIDRHIELYVNRFSENLGKEGEQAVAAFVREAEGGNIVPESGDPLFI
ncbi:MAG: 1,4-dihydroxy-6-naphthoate synthase [Desulfarculaceae bacterium]|nr:1,4-dihydroxy-6-naphthoate synthase [Desulfarculaceae bacterium]